MVKVLSTGDNPLISTGYGTVWENLLKRWAKLKPDWEFYHIGWQNQDREHKTIEGYTMLPMGRLEYGYDAVASQLEIMNPDYLITLADVGWQSGYVKIVYEAKKKGWKGKWIAYTPIDTHGWASTWDEAFAGPDINVAMAGFGEQQMKLHKLNNVVCIPHGVDTDTFKPIDQNICKAKYQLQNKFVVGFVGRNQRRKMVDRLLQSFDNFAKEKDDVILILHTDQEPPKDGWSIPYHIHQFKNLQNKTKLTKSNLDIAARQRISPGSLNEIYNMMDVFLYTTGGEGFGLPAIECQASGVTLLMNDCTTAQDLCRPENRITVLKDIHGRDMIDRGTNGVYFLYPDDYKAAEILEKHYKLWKEGKIDRIEPRTFAESYSWDLIAPKWIKLFEDNL